MDILVGNEKVYEGGWAKYSEDIKKAQKILKENGLDFEIVNDYKFTVRNEVDERLQSMEMEEIADMPDDQFEKLVDDITDELYNSDDSCLDLEFIDNIIDSKLDKILNEIAIKTIEKYMKEKNKVVDGFSVIKAIINYIYESGTDKEFYYTDDDLGIIIEGEYDRRKDQIKIENIRDI